MLVLKAIASCGGLDLGCEPDDATAPAINRTGAADGIEAAGKTDFDLKPLLPGFFPVFPLEPSIPGP